VADSENIFSYSQSFVNGSHSELNWRVRLERPEYYKVVASSIECFGEEKLARFVALLCAQ
jgi:hypothetical protein